ncbi:unknown [Clostridium sp. CAG:448]|nr:unknown [Clostridium sp. CAG:448]
MHQNRVAGLLNAACKGQTAVSLNLVAPDLASVDYIVTRTVEMFIFPHQVFFIRHCRSHNLEGRTRHIWLRNILVGPHGHDQLGLLIRVFLASLLKSRLRKFTQGLRIQHARLVQIEGRVNRHGNDRAGIDIHHDSAGAVFTAGFRIGRFQFLFQRRLDVQADGTGNIRTVRSGNIAVIFKRHFFTG